MPEIQNLDVWHISNKSSCLRTNFRVFSFNNSFLFTHKTSHALNFSHRLQPMRDLEFPSSSEFIEILSFEIACFNAHALILVYFQLLAQLLNLIFHNFYEKEGWEGEGPAMTTVSLTFLVMPQRILCHSEHPKNLFPHPPHPTSRNVFFPGDLFQFLFGKGGWGELGMMQGRWTGKETKFCSNILISHFFVYDAHIYAT